MLSAGKGGGDSNTSYYTMKHSGASEKGSVLEYISSDAALRDSQRNGTRIAAKMMCLRDKMLRVNPTGVSDPS